MLKQRFPTNRAVCFILSLALFSALQVQTASAQDAEAGAKVFKKCKACHAVGEGARNKIGPHLNKLVGRTAGAIEGFKYSKAMKEAGTAGTIWKEDTLDQYLTAPKKFIKGTKMAFVGLKKEEDRKNLFAYLSSLDNDTAQNSDTSAKTELAVATPDAQPEPPVFTDEFLNDSVNFDKGKELWYAQCTHCHGFKAYPGKAPKLKPNKYTADFVYKRVTKGFKKMPGWEETFSQAERMAIVAYVKSKSFSP